MVPLEVRDAAHLWGQDTLEANHAIKKELGDHSVRVASIGQAGRKYGELCPDRV